MSDFFASFSFVLGAVGIVCGLAAFDSEVQDWLAGGAFVLGASVSRLVADLLA